MDDGLLKTRGLLWAVGLHKSCGGSRREVGSMARSVGPEASINQLVGRADAEAKQQRDQSESTEVPGNCESMLESK